MFRFAVLAARALVRAALTAALALESSSPLSSAASAVDRYYISRHDGPNWHNIDHFDNNAEQHDHSNYLDYFNHWNIDENYQHWHEQYDFSHWECFNFRTTTTALECELRDKQPFNISCLC